MTGGMIAAHMQQTNGYNHDSDTGDVSFAAEEVVPEDDYILAKNNRTNSLGGQAAANSLT